MLDRRPLSPDQRPGLYVHVPFCARICPYCDFSVVGSRHPGRADYVESLLREAESWSRGPSVALAAEGGAGSPGEDAAARVFGSVPFGSVYFGGGTPSVLDNEELSRLVDGLRQRLDIADDASWTLEANPEHVDRDFAQRLARLGIDHVSLGVQSLDRAVLWELGRGHRAADVLDAVRRLREAGVGWISVDLIYAVNSDLDAWMRQIEEAVTLRPDHLSCYELTIHSGTRFGREVAEGRREVVDEEVRHRFFVATLRRLSEAGYAAYEVSNFAAGPQARSPHNQKYWTGVPYLGLGPSSHSFDGGRRWWNHRSLRDWRRAVTRDGAAVGGHESLGPRELLLERLMTGTRTVPGLDLPAVERELGIDLVRESSSAIERLIAAGRIELLENGRRLAPTLSGLATADQLAIDLFPEGR